MLDAETPPIVTKDGKILVRPDNSTRLRALEFIYAYVVGRPIERQQDRQPDDWRLPGRFHGEVSGIARVSRYRSEDVGGMGGSSVVSSAASPSTKGTGGESPGSQPQI